jgi:hypothetical protein
MRTSYAWDRKTLALSIGRVDTVYCGVDTGLLPHYRDPMLGENRISGRYTKITGGNKHLVEVP